MSTPAKLPKLPTGIERRIHSKGRPRYRASVYSKATGHRKGSWVRSLAEAKSWRAKALA